MDEHREAGTARNVAALDAPGTFRDSVAPLEKWLRHSIETQPYTAALVAIGVGWLLDDYTSRCN